MRRLLLQVVTVVFAIGIMVPKVIHATQTLSENPGTPWFQLNSNTGNVSYLLHNAGDNSNLEFAANNNGAVTWQALNINKNGSVGVGGSVSAGSKFQVYNATTNLWGGRFLTQGSDVRIGYAGGNGIFMQSDVNAVGYQLRIFKGSDLKFEIQHDGKTFINNTLTAKQIVVKTSVWADNVFGNDYKLLPLQEIARYINENKHLPGIASEKDLIENGISVADMQTKQMQKIEELTLYAIDQDKKINDLEARLSKLENLIVNE